MKKIRLFLVVRKDGINKRHIAGLIKSSMYPSTYANDNPQDKIIELPEIDSDKDYDVVGCYMKL